MAKIPVWDIGKVGMISDIPGYRLPPEAWTKLENVETKDGALVPIKGEVDDIFGTPTITPYWIYPMPGASSMFWLYAGLDDIYAYSTAHEKLTRVSGVYTGTVDDPWVFTWLNGIGICNNGVDDPQVWNPIQAATDLIDLTNWPANTKAKVIRAYKNFLVALNITKSGTNYPTTVKWSSPADPGSVPDSWDETDASKLTGEQPLSATSGELVDAVTLGDALMLYKEDAIIRMQFVGGQNVFDFPNVSQRTGIMGVNCAREFLPGKNILFTLEGDIVITNGQTIESIAKRKVRKHIENTIAGESRTKSFVVVDPVAKQVWICYPEAGETYCTTALVWNYEENTFSFREITPTLSIESGLYDPTAASNIWSGQSANWNTAEGAWGGRNFKVGVPNLLGAFPGVADIAQLNEGTTLRGNAITARIERYGLAIAGVARDGTLKVDPKKVKLVTEIWPIIEASVSMTFNVYVGAQEFANGPVAWADPVAFDPTVDEKVETLIEGQYIALRFETTSTADWKFHGVELDISLIGEQL